MATTSSTENMFPSSSSATSSITSGTSGGSALGGGSDMGGSGMSGSGMGSTTGSSGLQGGADSAMGSTTGTGTRPEVLNRVVQGAHNAIDRLADTVAPHVQRLGQGVGSASESLQLRADHAREVGDEWAETLRSTVRENPLAAVATALAVGLLVAKLTR